MREYLFVVTNPETPSQLESYLLFNTALGQRRLPLTASSCWTVGRNDDNNLVLSDQWISRNHAMIQSMESGEFYLIDLGSRNGSFINGRRVTVPVPLHSGDMLTFGQTELQFFCSSADAAAADSTDSDYSFTATAAIHVRRLVSTAVIDLCDFTAMTQCLNEKDLSEAVGSWFRQAGEVLRRYGGWVDRYTGSAITAVWIHGTQDVPREESLRTIRAVCDLQQVMNDLNQRYALPMRLRIGVGLDQGYAMVGDMESGLRPEYAVLGDTIDDTRQYELATQHLGLDVAVSSKLYQQLGQLGMNEQTFKQYSVQLKGQSYSLATYACAFSDLGRFLSAYEDNQVDLVSSQSY
ncbi:adenylate/guanylate cyclase domain-containing protein [Romeria aff. gracilis LEGE 07310]|uniref:Adenylate/guanylate cyclase domain-containing protein n=1 Tax=Vasconcelosia minhoensis LEGE 07310 TaxID=915328 RepID=A0A8J7A5M1_9CYAN|nr:adenylate/guanylate cyclase domain-containing protein [Romeria gracilis]MBE9076877.1 adenylate/guanylate cyclase domain-containing protein [Romeria aff. gracilis LEGE 07310]